MGPRVSKMCCLDFVVVYTTDVKSVQTVSYEHRNIQAETLKMNSHNEGRVDPLMLLGNDAADCQL